MIKNKSNSQTYIYVIKNEIGMIKVGLSNDPFRRIKQLQTGNNAKLKFLAITQADRGLEKRLHKMFFFNRQVGEWFNLSPEAIELLLNYLRERYPTTIFENEQKYIN